MGKDRWQTGVCGGEISYYKSSDQKNFTNPAGMYGHTWEEMARKYHISFMIANDNPGGKNSWNNPTRFKECSMAAGYHFVVTDCRTDGTATKITVENKGAAPIYRDAYFAVGGVRSEQSLKGLLPGASLEVVVSAPLMTDSKGTLVNAPEIVSDYILDTQKIEYDSNVTTDIGVAETVEDCKDPKCYGIDGMKATAGMRGVVIMCGKKICK